MSNENRGENRDSKTVLVPTRRDEFGDLVDWIAVPVENASQWDCRRFSAHP